MNSLELEIPVQTEETVSPEMIRNQLETLVRDEGFRSSKRSIAFLRYVIEETLNGAADQIKERTIGVEVFGRSTSYEPNLDHIVRTAASEVRKRLAIYYGDEAHKNELRILIPPGSYIPRFSLRAGDTADEEAAARSNGPTLAPETASPPEPPARRPIWIGGGVLACLILLALGVDIFVHLRSGAESAFWRPILDTHQPVLLALGDVPHGPPHAQPTAGEQAPLPIIAQPTAQGSVPLADAVTMARLYSALQAHGNRVVVRPGSSIAFSDLREGPVVLIGAFNNPWSLRLIGKLRFSLALDDSRQLIYIRDSRNPDARTWSWGTHQPVSNVGGAGTPVLHDFALISRVRSPETGHFMVVVGGLFVYGTQAAGEFLSDPEALKALNKVTSMDSNKSLQIVLETTVTDATPGPARVVAISEE
jgi:hypothetical protein